MAEKKQGRTWTVVAALTKYGNVVKKIKRTVLAGSEAELERAEKALKKKLADEAMKSYSKEELKAVRIDVETEIQA